MNNVSTLTVNIIKYLGNLTDVYPFFKKKNTKENSRAVEIDEETYCLVCKYDLKSKLVRGDVSRKVLIIVSPLHLQDSITIICNIELLGNGNCNIVYVPPEVKNNFTTVNTFIGLQVRNKSLLRDAHTRFINKEPVRVEDPFYICAMTDEYVLLVFNFKSVLIYYHAVYVDFVNFINSP